MPHLTHLSLAKVHPSQMDHVFGFIRKLTKLQHLGLIGADNSGDRNWMDELASCLPPTVIELDLRGLQLAR